VLVHLAVSSDTVLTFVSSGAGAFVSFFELRFVDLIESLNFVFIIGHNLFLISMKLELASYDKFILFFLHESLL
jgi:hypothetical protein